MNFNRFVGLSYVDCGRNFKGVDCYGLLWLVYYEVLKIELQSYHTRYVTSVDRKATAALIAGELDPWLEITDGSEMPFDAMLMRIGRDVMHVGVLVEKDKVLHIERGDLSKIELYKTGKLRHRIAGFYRYRGK